MELGRVKAIVQARMTSERLPGKVLLPILGKPMLELLVERLREAKMLDGIVVATTVNPKDNSIEKLCKRLGIEVFRGSETDVLERVVLAAQSSETDTIVQITGDCPLVDPDLVDRLVTVYLDESVDYVSNILKRTYPRGFDTQIFSRNTLERVDQLTSDPADREHVSLYIYEHPDEFRLLNVESGLPEKYWRYRLTVDTPEDFSLISNIFELLYPANPHFRLHDVLDVLDHNPKLLELNRDVSQKQPR